MKKRNVNFKKLSLNKIRIAGLKDKQRVLGGSGAPCDTFICTNETEPPKCIGLTPSCRGC